LSADNRNEDFVRDINERRAELRAQREQGEAQLAEVEQRILAAPNPGLIDALPVMKIDVEQLPEELARALFEALRLEIRYNRDTHTATCRITPDRPHHHRRQPDRPRRGGHITRRRPTMP
jgi:hypothetical protein